MCAYETVSPYKQLRIALEHVYCCCIRQTVMGYTRTFIVLSAFAVMQGCEISDCMKPAADKCIQMSAICMNKYIQLSMYCTNQVYTNDRNLGTQK